MVPHPVINLGFFKIQFGDGVLQYWYLLLVIVAIVYILFTKLERSRTGRAWAAIREDEIAAQASGVNTTRVKLLAFAIGCVDLRRRRRVLRQPGRLLRPDQLRAEQLHPRRGLRRVRRDGCSLPGAMAGAAVLTWLPEFLKDQVPSADRQMWIGLVILLMMIFRPAGLIPAKRRLAELKGLHGESDLEASAVPAGEGMGVKA